MSRAAFAANYPEFDVTVADVEKECDLVVEDEESYQDALTSA